MQRQISHLTLVVRDYDEAIAYYRDVLAFDLLEDVDMGNGKRWVKVGPAGGAGASLLLARAANAEQTSRVGNQTGGRVFLFLDTDDLDRDHREMTALGVHFEEAPRSEEYGRVAVFADLYGNRWDLVERRDPAMG